MIELHKNQINNQLIEPKEGQRGFLCSNNDPFRCPSLENVINEEEQSLEFLSMILVKAFIKKKKNELN